MHNFNNRENVWNIDDLYTNDGNLKNYVVVSNNRLCTDEEERQNKRRNYESLEEFATEEGIGAVLDFLSRSPTQIIGVNGSYYRHTKMSSINANGYRVTKFG